MSLPSDYYQIERIAAEVSGGGHREAVGGLWDELGKLQFDFLLSRGLLPHHKLVDIGCGCLRGGVHFVRYLDPECYFGTDINQALLDAGAKIELAALGLQHKLSPKNLRCDAEFKFYEFGVSLDFALAQSLFTHLPMNHLRLCLSQLARSMRSGGLFYTTFFERPDHHPLSDPLRHEPGGVITTSVQDPYHYSYSEIAALAQGLPWEISYIGDWGHPRGQRMVEFFRI